MRLFWILSGDKKFFSRGNQQSKSISFSSLFSLRTRTHIFTYFRMNSYNDNNNVFICSRIFCCFSLGSKGKKVGVYFAGILVCCEIEDLLCLQKSVIKGQKYQFALGWWTFIDGLAVLWNLQDRQIAPGIEDWVPGIVTTLGMIM